MECEEIRELLDEHALGALDSEERSRVDLHLQNCADCQALATEYAEVIRILPQALAAASPLSPPPSLRTRLLSSLETAPRSEAASHDSIPKSREQAEERPQPSSTPFRLAGLNPRAIGALAAVLLLVLSMLWGFSLNAALAQERALRAEYANLVDRQEVVLEVIDSRNTVKALLRATESGSTSYGKLYTRPDLPHVVAMAARLPQPPPGHAYHLWLTSQGQTQLAGVLAVNEGGFGLLVFDADRNGPVYDSALLTLQPDGGVTPTENTALLWRSGP